MRRKKEGKKVYFSIANAPMKFHGKENYYYYKNNLHNIIFKGTKFINCRFKAGHMTECNFRNVKFIGCDFVGINLRGSDFRNAEFNNCTFFNCRIQDANFKDSIFIDTFFLSSNTNDTFNLSLSDSNIVTQYPVIVIQPYLKYKLEYLNSFNRIKKYNVLQLENGKINNWYLFILLKKFTSRELSLFLTKICLKSNSKQKKFITLNTFIEDMERYYKK